MPSRNGILAAAFGFALAAMPLALDRGHAESTAGHVVGATAITQVFGDGQKLTAVAVEYDRPIDGIGLSRSSFRVEGRTVVGVHPASAPSSTAEGPNGRYVVVELSPDDPAASLRKGGPGSSGPPKATADGQRHEAGPPSGPPKFGPRQVYGPVVASVTQVEPIMTIGGDRYDPSGAAIVTTRTQTPIVDDFRELVFHDPKTGGVLKYNLFVPKDYDATRSYPLVLFIHDAGTLSDDPTTTLKQGLGAVAWASPADQARHPAFVLAPQYAQVAVDDLSKATSDLDATVDLVEALSSQYAIDRTRLYTSGQSMGAMMSIAMDIKYPDLFAASFIVAGQWDPEKVKPLAHQKLWIVVSQGDLKAYPGENAMTATLEREGAKVGRAVWDGRSSPEAFATAVQALETEDAPINYVALAKGTVVPPGQRYDGGGNHMNTWRIAYGIPGIRDWIFAQRKAPETASEAR